MCRSQDEGGRRCDNPAAHAKHNNRRRANRARDKTIRTLHAAGILARPGRSLPPQYFVGTGKLDPTRIPTAQDHDEAPVNKPSGGLWTSGRSDDGLPGTAWSQWMASNQQLTSAHTVTTVHARAGTVAVTLDTPEDVQALARLCPPEQFLPDGTPRAPFSYDKARAAGIDAIHATSRVTGYGRPMEGWDVESTVWLNPGKVRAGATAPTAHGNDDWGGDDWDDWYDAQVAEEPATPGF